VDAQALRAATGIEIVPIEPGEVLDRWRAVQPSQVRAFEEEVDAVWERAPDIEDGESLIRSLRAAAAMERIVEDYQLDAGAMNCHVPDIRFGEEIGITPCYALGRLTSRGIPWTCTGDVPTAVAMLTVKRLGGVSVYHELEAVDYATGEFVIANSGEHDLGWCAPDERPRLRRNGWFDGIDPRCGVCGCFEATPGPATLVGFTAHPRAAGGFRFITARGAITARRFRQTGTLNGAFRFASGPPEEAWARWVMAGVSHHSCATRGNYSGMIKRVARHLRIEAVDL
jgi:L-arabinose isomerase